MIIHHYKLSPFSEKIRLMLGYCELDWQSAISPAMPPRPIVDPLVGGYRRIPIAQVGADLFCDTRIICAEIAELANKPELASENCSSEMQAFVNHVDSAVFSATVRCGEPLKSMLLLASNMWPWQVQKFIKDRAQMGKASSMPRLSKGEANEVLLNHKNDLEAKLKENPYLFGDHPSIADFSSYHVAWFANNITSGQPFSGFENSQKWFKRMALLGHGTSMGISKAKVFKTATESKPRSIPQDMKNHRLLGEKVEIGPTDYAKDTVTGKLVGSSSTRLIVQRVSDQFGEVHIHFPVDGFELKMT